MTLLALFLALGKRRQEIVSDEKTPVNRPAPSCRSTTCASWTRCSRLVSSTTVMAYSLYTFSAPNLPPNHLMMLTIPFVLYGLFRYLYLIHVKGETDPPDIVVLKIAPYSSICFYGQQWSVLIFYVVRPLHVKRDNVKCIAHADHVHKSLSYSPRSSSREKLRPWSIHPIHGDTVEDAEAAVRLALDQIVAQLLGPSRHLPQTIIPVPSDLGRIRLMLQVLADGIAPQLAR